MDLKLITKKKILSCYPQQLVKIQLMFSNSSQKYFFFLSVKKGGNYSFGQVLILFRQVQVSLHHLVMFYYCTLRSVILPRLHLFFSQLCLPCCCIKFFCFLLNNKVKKMTASMGILQYPAAQLLNLFSVIQGGLKRFTKFRREPDSNFKLINVKALQTAITSGCLLLLLLPFTFVTFYLC